MANYRLDRITNIQLLDTSAKPMKQVKGPDNDFDLPKHMAEHIYMFQDGSVHTKFRTKKYLISNIIDWFGTKVRFSNETENEVTVSVNVNEEAMRRLATQYALHIKVLEPAELVDKVKEDLTVASKNYCLL